MPPATPVTVSMAPTYTVRSHFESGLGVGIAGTIPGGTSEIQRNIIAERVLGLPRT